MFLLNEATLGIMILESYKNSFVVGDLNNIRGPNILYIVITTSTVIKKNEN
jgi:hypothetical protein